MRPYLAFDSEISAAIPVSAAMLLCIFCYHAVNIIGYCYC